MCDFLKLSYQTPVRPNRSVRSENEDESFISALIKLKVGHNARVSRFRKQIGCVKSHSKALEIAQPGKKVAHVKLITFNIKNKVAVQTKTKYIQSEQI